MLIDGLYNLEFKDNKKAVVQLCDENHPIFKAHFPTKPIMPGFMHFEIIADIWGEEITTIKKAKFLQLVQPNKILVYKKKGNKFQVFCENDNVASIIL